MRVLFVPREDADRIFGGDVVQMRKTAESLERLGVDVVTGPARRACEEPFDVVHLWTSLHTPAVLNDQLDALQPARANTKIALSTIWAPHHLVRWMDTARRWLFSLHPDPERISLTSARNELQQIADRSLDFTLGGEKLTAFAPHPLTPDCRQVLARVDTILPNSWMELQAIFTYLGDFCNYAIVPNAVDPADFAVGESAELPPELASAPYAMMCARFDTRKQQDLAMLAIKELGIPILFVGHQTDTEIFDRVRALGNTAKAPVYYVSFTPHERLAHLYRGARIHILPSIFESPGLSSLEAALLDCSIVTGNLGYESEYFAESAYYCDPCNAFSVARAIERAWTEHDTTTARRELLRERILTNYTWPAAAQATKTAYEKMLN